MRNKRKFINFLYLCRKYDLEEIIVTHNYYGL